MRLGAHERNALDKYTSATTANAPYDVAELAELWP